MDTILVVAFAVEAILFFLWVYFVAVAATLILAVLTFKIRGLLTDVCRKAKG